MVFATPEDAEYLNERFDIYGGLPRTRDGVEKMVRAMISGYDSIAVELPSVTLPAALFEALRKLSTKYAALAEGGIRKETSEQKAATVSKNLTRANGEKLMRRVYHRAVAYWGDDDPRMLEIGLMPKSSIGTPGEPEEPGPENWDDPPTGFSMSEGPPGFANTSATLHPDADGAGIYLVEGPLGEEVQPVMSPTPAEPQVPLPYGLPINDGVRTWVWICAVKNGVLGQVTGPEWIEQTL